MVYCKLLPRVDGNGELVGGEGGFTQCKKHPSSIIEKKNQNQKENWERERGGGGVWGRTPKKKRRQLFILDSDSLDKKTSLLGACTVTPPAISGSLHA